VQHKQFTALLSQVTSKSITRRELKEIEKYEDHAPPLCPHCGKKIIIRLDLRLANACLNRGTGMATGLGREGAMASPAFVRL
jgi:predicted RNA-binding Zn-ribbon protein involved in translation (DUF1610 family)